MMDIQEFAKNVSINNAPAHWVEVNQLRKYWRQNGVKELSKVFADGDVILYDKEIDWKAISEHKKNLWYEDYINYQKNNYEHFQR